MLNLNLQMKQQGKVLGFPYYFIEKEWRAGMVGLAPKWVRLAPGANLTHFGAKPTIPDQGATHLDDFGLSIERALVLVLPQVETFNAALFCFASINGWIMILHVSSEVSKISDQGILFQWEIVVSASIVKQKQWRNGWVNPGLFRLTHTSQHWTFSYTATGTGTSTFPRVTRQMGEI